MSRLRAAVHPLIRSHLKRRPDDGKIERVKPLLTQLMDAREPDAGQKRNSGSEQPVPINVPAVDLWAELEDDARTEQWHRTRDDSGGLWQILEVWAELDAPEWEDYLVKVVTEFCDRIELLIEPPPKRRPLRHKCPACKRRWIKTPDGERRESLTAGVFYDDGTLRLPADYDVSCANCNAEWRGEDLTKVLPRITSGLLEDTRERETTHV